MPSASVELQELIRRHFATNKIRINPHERQCSDGRANGEGISIFGADFNLLFWLLGTRNSHQIPPSACVFVLLEALNSAHYGDMYLHTDDHARIRGRGVIAGGHNQIGCAHVNGRLGDDGVQEALNTCVELAQQNKHVHIVEYKGAHTEKAVLVVKHANVSVKHNVGPDQMFFVYDAMAHDKYVNTMLQHIARELATKHRQRLNINANAVKRYLNNQMLQTKAWIASSLPIVEID